MRLDDIDQTPRDVAGLLPANREAGGVWQTDLLHGVHCRPRETAVPTPEAPHALVSKCQPQVDRSMREQFVQTPGGVAVSVLRFRANRSSIPTKNSQRILYVFRWERSGRVLTLLGPMTDSLGRAGNPGGRRSWTRQVHGGSQARRHP